MSKAQEFQTPLAKFSYRFRIPEAKVSQVRNPEKTLNRGKGDDFRFA